MRTSSLGLGLIICLCLSFLSPCRGGVPADTSVKVQIRWLQSPWNLPTAVQHQTTNHLVDWLQSRGMRVADKAEYILWCDVYSFEGPDSGNVVLSVGLGKALPAQLIDFGTKAEILYAGISAKKKTALPKEGKWVRESLTEDFLYEYMRPVDHELVIVSKAHLLERLDVIVEQLYRRNFKH
jgi:hypothetical protein